MHDLSPEEIERLREIEPHVQVLQGDYGWPMVRSCINAEIAAIKTQMHEGVSGKLYKEKVITLRALEWVLACVSGAIEEVDQARREI